MNKYNKVKKEYAAEDLHFEVITEPGPGSVLFEPLASPQNRDGLSDDAPELIIDESDYVPVYLGIDQSLNCTGICIIRGDEVLHHEVFMFPKKIADYQPLDKMISQNARLTKILNEFTPVIDYIAMEGPAYNARGRGSTSLAGVFYFLLYACRLHNDENPLIVPPSTLKKFATGKGNASKKEMIAALPEGLHRIFYNAYGITTGRSDVTDAYYLARAVQTQRGQE